MTQDLVDAVVRVVDHQTGGPQPEHVPMRVILTVLASHGSEDAGAVRKAVEKAVADGRLRYDEDEQVFWLPK